MVITFRLRRSRGEMYIGHDRLCVYLYVHRRISTLLHGLDTSFMMVGVTSGCATCALLGGYAIGARVSNAKCQRVLVLALCLAGSCDGVVMSGSTCRLVLDQDKVRRIHSCLYVTCVISSSRLYRQMDVYNGVKK